MQIASLSDKLPNKMRGIKEHIALTVVAITSVALVALELAFPSLTNSFITHPLILAALVDILLIATGYLYLRGFFEKSTQDREQKSQLAVVYEMKKRGDAVDKEVFQLIRRYLLANSLPGPTTQNSRQERNQAVSEHLSAALLDRESLLSHNPTERLSDELESLQMTILMANISLAADKNYQELLDLLPSLKQRTSALVRKLKSLYRYAEVHPKGVNQKLAEETLIIWKEYEQVRSQISQLVMPLFIYQKN